MAENAGFLRLVYLLIRRHRGKVGGVVTALAVTIAVVVVAFENVRRSERRAIAARRLAEQKQQEADRARQLAEQRRREAEAARLQAAQENYINVIALSQSRFAEGDTRRANRLLNRTPQEFRHWEFQRLQYLADLSLLRLDGHQSNVVAVAYSPDGRRVASVGLDHRTCIWDAATGSLVQRFSHPRIRRSALTFTADSRELVLQAGPRVVGFYSVADGHLIRQLTTTSKREAKTLRLFDGDARLLVLAGPHIEIFDTATLQQVQRFSENVLAPSTAAVSPDGTVVAGGVGPGVVRFWDVATGHLKRNVKLHTGLITHLEFSPDGKLLASAGADGNVVLYELRTGRVRQPFTGHAEAVNAVVFSPDGTQLASAGADNTIRIWSLDTGREALRLTAHHSRVLCLAYSPDGRRLVSGAGDASVRLWDAAGRRDVIDVKPHTSYLHAIGFAGDGRTLATSSQDGRLQLLDPATGRVRRVLYEGKDHHAYALAFSPDGHWLATGWDRYGPRLKLWNPAGAEALVAGERHRQLIKSIAFSQDGKYILTGSADHSCALWRSIDLQLVQRYRGGGEILGVAFLPGTRRFFCCDDAGFIRIWNLDGADRPETVLGRRRVVQAAAVHADEGLAALAAGRAPVVIWDVPNGCIRQRLEGHREPVTAIAFSADAKRVITAARDETVRLWDTVAGREILVLRWPDAWITRVVMDPAGRCIIAAARDGRLRIWPANSR